MSTSCMQAIKQQLEAMPLEEFEDLLKGVAVNKGHEGMPQHAELLSQLKHHVKVQPDEPIQTKASDKDCRTFWKSLNQRDKGHRLSSSSNSNSSGCSNLNGSVGSSGNHNSHYNHHKHSSSFGSTSAGRSFPTGDQNANPVSSTSDTPSSAYYHQPVNNLIQGKYHDYINHHHIHHQSTLAYGNCVSSSDADPGGLSRRSHDGDSKNDNTISTCSTIKNSYNADDDQQDEDKPEEYTGTLPAQYILPSVTKFSNKELPLQFFQQSKAQLQNSVGASSHDGNPGSSSPSICQTRPINIDTSAPSSSSWDLPNNRNTPIQLNESYKSVSSVTSGASPYGGRSHDQVHGTIQAVSPTLPPSALITKSPPIEGSQLDKPTRRGGDRKKKSAKHVLRETVINPQEMQGYKGNLDLDKVLEFVEGNQSKKDKNKPKDKKREVKPKGSEKQVLSKAASLDENSLDYGSKKTEDVSGKSRNSKEVEKKNATNITKSSAVYSSGLIPIMTKNVASSEAELASPKEGPSTDKNKNISTTTSTTTSSLVNGSAASTPPSKNNNGGSAGSTKASATPSINKPAATKTLDKVVSTETDPAPPPETPVTSSAPVPDSKFVKGTAVRKLEDDKFGKLDESDGPYVLVQSKKKKEKKKSQPRETETFSRPHTDQSRRDVARVRRTATERRKSVGSVPGSENSECSDDDDSVRSLPAGECTPREKIPKPCSSSGGTPQTSYADIARMSRDENGKPPTSQIALLPGVSNKSPPTAVKATQGVVAAAAAAAATVAASVTVTSDTNFPALSPPSLEKTVNVNAAVWPCRPRIEPDSKQQTTAPATTSTKTQDENSNPVENSLIPVSTNDPTCSIKAVVPAPQDCAPDSKPSAEFVVQTPANVSENRLADPVNQTKSGNGVGSDSARSRDSTATENGRPAPSISSKPSVNKGTEDKKRKGDKMKIQEDFIKGAAGRGMENGESTAHPTEPVVFCGGKFDSSQLSVGQNVGFEFGFGVIEALNDNGGVSDSATLPSTNNTPAVTLPPLVSAQGYDVTRGTDRSQDRLPSKQNPCEKTEKSLSSTIPVAQDKRSKAGSIKIGNTSPKDELCQVRAASSESGEVPAGQKVLSATNVSLSIGTAVTGAVAELIEKPESSQIRAADEQPPSACGQQITNFAQQIVFTPPTGVVVPDVHQGRVFVDNHISRLHALEKEGRATFHRL